MHPRQVLTFACCCLPVFWASAADGPKAGVAVVKKPAEVQEKPFDRKQLPDAVSLRPQDRAYTDCSYFITVDLRCEPQPQTSFGGQVTAEVTGIKVVLELKTTLWLPPNAPRKLRDHEQGHRKIGELFYATAEAEAKRLCQARLGKAVTGSGSTPEKALQNAARTASDALMKEYLAAINGEAQKVHALYDEITEHGTKLRVGEDAAIKEAMERWRREEAKGKVQAPASR